MNITLEATTWAIKGDDPIHPKGRIELVPRPDGPARYAVRKSGDCLNREGQWEWEPRPSERDEGFFARCRFDTLDEARAALEAAL